MRSAPKVILSDVARAELNRLVRSGKTPVRLCERAQIVLRAADHVTNKDIAAELGIDWQRVARWRKRFIEGGLAALAKDRPRGRKGPHVATPEKEAEIVRLTTREAPPNRTHWSTRTMAVAAGVSEKTVRRIWRKNGLKPHLMKTFKVSNDPQFAEKLEDVVGLYLSPPDNAIVLSCDEKSQIQALDRTQPGLPLKKGRAGTMTHDYIRNGTTTLFAALNVLTGVVIGTCMQKHRHTEWLKFLRLIDASTPKDKDLHIIADNYATHKHPAVRKWLLLHPRFHMHFTPTSSSWLNMVERFFRDITQNAIRRGEFVSVEHLVDTIDEYLKQHNKAPKPFIWTAKASDILEKVTRARAKVDTYR